MNTLSWNDLNQALHIAISVTEDRLINKNIMDKSIKKMLRSDLERFRSALNTLVSVKAVDLKISL